jgi:prevent-host-death family protein
MALIGIRELRENTSEVIRQVREEKKEYVITHQGRPVALLLPLDEEAVAEKLLEISKQASSDPWTAYELLAESLRREMPPGKSTQDILDEIRGEE